MRDFSGELRFNGRLEKMEERFAKSLDELTKTLDKFLKRLSDIEEEFTFMKADLNRVKAVLREKLGVVLDYFLLSTRPRLARSSSTCWLVPQRQRAISLSSFSISLIRSFPIPTGDHSGAVCDLLFCKVAKWCG